MKVWIESNGDVLPFDIPTAVHERTFENFCDFKGARERLTATDNQEFSAVDLISILSHMIDGDLSKLPIHDGRDIGDLIDSGYMIKLEEDVTLWTLYAHVVNLIKTYVPDHVPDEFKLNFAGNNFRVTKKRVHDILTDTAITTGEVIETLEFQRIATHNIEQEPAEVGNLEFSLGLSEFAILVRKPGEELPFQRSELDKFVDERRVLFRHLPLNYVLDLRFFFIYSLMSYDQTRGLNSSGKALHISKSPKKAKWIKRGR